MKRKSPAEKQGSWKEAKASVGLDPGPPAKKDITPPSGSSRVKPKDADSPPGQVEKGPHPDLYSHMAPKHHV